MKPKIWGFFLCFVVMNFVCVGQSKEPVSKDELKLIQNRFTAQQNTASVRLKRNPDDIAAYSTRGDARLFLGNFKGAKKDYEKMIVLNPKLDVSHWRLGIAYFYLKEYDKAARQFKIYHNYDQVDRENGIWRFMSQYKASGLEVARKGLLKYEKDDRPPYPWLYDMFAGNIRPSQVFSKIEEEAFDDRYKTRVLFHAYLYVGIYVELTDDANKALPYLREAAANAYGKATGTYMWQVARTHYRLSKEATKLEAEEAGKNSPRN